MPGEKASFESKDLTGGSGEKDEKLQKFMGEERRRKNRRTGEERREDIRFEFGKEDRRKNHGRRDADRGPDFW